MRIIIALSAGLSLLVWIAVITMPAWSFYFYGAHEGSVFMDTFFSNSINVFGRVGTGFLWFFTPLIGAFSGMIALMQRRG
jgi:hypothetical protein